MLSVISYKDDGDAVRIANDSIFGLGGSVWSADSERAKKVARRVQTGTIGINGYMPSLGSPFGGVSSRIWPCLLSARGLVASTCSSLRLVFFVSNT